MSSPSDPDFREMEQAFLSGAIYTCDKETLMRYRSALGRIPRGSNPGFHAKTSYFAQTIFHLISDHEAKSSLATTVRWAKVAGISALAAVGLGGIQLILQKCSYTSEPETTEERTPTSSQSKQTSTTKET